MTKKNITYFYEHTNGNIVSLPSFVVDTAGGPLEYFDSPFVKRWWTEDRIEEDESP